MANEAKSISVLFQSLPIPREDLETILLVCRYFPPYDFGRVGHSVRMSYLSEFLSQNGYNVCVALIMSRMESFSLDAGGQKKSATILNDYLLQKSRWEKNLDWAVEDLITFVNHYNVKKVITSSPPLEAHYVGMKIRYGADKAICWLADVRDVSCLHPSVRSPPGKNEEQIMDEEASLLSAADIITTVSCGAKAALENEIAEFAKTRFFKNIFVIENGYIPDPFISLPPETHFQNFVKECHQDERLVLAYSGTGEISGLGRPYGYKDLRSLIELINAVECARVKVGLVAQGQISVNNQYLEQVRGAVKLNILPGVSNEQVRANLRLADVGVFICLDERAIPTVIGGKIYDYLSLGLPILLIVPTGADSLEGLSRQFPGRFFFCKPGDQLDFGAAITLLYEKHRDGSLRTHDLKALNEFSRGNQYQRFLRLIN